MAATPEVAKPELAQSYMHQARIALRLDAGRSATRAAALGRDADSDMERSLRAKLRAGGIAPRGVHSSRFAPSGFGRTEWSFGAVSGVLTLD